MNQFFLNLYIRDIEFSCKNTKNVENKQIVRVKNLILIYEFQHFFGIYFFHNQISR